MRATRLDAVIAVAIGALGCAYRFLAHTAFNNDQFVHLARAQAWLAGDWPIRDYEEPGAILTVGVSAAAQALFGQSLLPELLLSVGALGVAAALTCWLVIRLTGSRALGVLAAILQLAIFPRLYAYPKILLYPVGIILLHRYSVSPTRARLAAAAAWVAVSFLLRQDHGVYAAAATVLTVILVHWRDGVGIAARQTGVFAAFFLALLLPFLIYVQANLGLLTYLRLGVGIYEGEADRTRPALPAFTFDRGSLLVRKPLEATDLASIHIRWAPHVDDGLRRERERVVPLLHAEHLDGQTWRYRIGWDRAKALAPLLTGNDVEDVEGIDRRTLELETARPLGTRVLETLGLLGLRPGPPIVSLVKNAGPLLFYMAWLLPFAAFLFWLKQEHRDSAVIVPVICALSLICAAGFQRNDPAVRTPDMFGTFPILVALVLAAIFANRPPRRRTLIRTAGVAFVVVACASVASLGDAGERLARTGLFDGPAAMLARTSAIARSAREWPWVAQWPGDEDWKVARYVHDCTQPGDRLLVTWFAPEYYVFSRRPFAGRETVLMPFYRNPATYEARVLEAWKRQSVPIVLAEESTYPTFTANYPALSQRLASRYRHVGSVVSRIGPIGVYIDRERVASGTDTELGWDCFASR
jgi:hypothetical protein